MTMIEQHHVPASLRIRQAIAWPIYFLALVLDVAAAAVGRLAAAVADDPWPK